MSKGIASLLAIATIVVEAAAMEFVGAGLGLDGDHASGGFAELRVVVLKRDLGFLDGVEVRVDDDDSQNGILVVGAIELEGSAAEVLAVHEDLLRALRVLGRGVAPSDDFLRAGGEKLEVGEVAIENRQVFDVFRVEFDGNVSAVGLELLDLAADFDGLCNVSDGQRGILAHRSVRGNLDVLDFKNFETGAFDPDVVEIWNQVRDGKVAAIVCGRFFDRTFSDVSDCHLCAHNAGALRISDRTENAAKHSLRNRLRNVQAHC